MSKNLLQITDLHLSFRTASEPMYALNGINLDIQPGEIFGIVGETGCGKTVTGLSVLQLLPDSADITEGKILFDGVDLLELDLAAVREYRGGKVAMIFQDPSSSLNPVFTIGSQFIRIVKEHLDLSVNEARQHALEMLRAVGLPDVTRVLRSYPHQLSGGMQQRVMIALALACKPRLLIADEPTTALDVTIQAQILSLIKNLRDEFEITVILITHNLGVVAKTCDRLAVLYAGRVVESGPTKKIFEQPSHPYTQGLMSAIPRPNRRGSRMSTIPGSVPANPGLVKGCAFAPRCNSAFERCFSETPGMFTLDENHSSACFLEDPEMESKE